ncbi:MAG: chromate efflux transporter [Verrucomicrobiota bacterium]
MKELQNPAASLPPEPPTFRQALAFWLKLGLISFGGPAAQIAAMHRELVETKRWMDERHFLNGLNFCMLLPGPEAQQLATYLGWRLHGAKGGIAAGALFVLPSALILLALSWLYIAGSEVPAVGAFFHGLLGAVIALVLDALLRIGGKALRSPTLVGLAVVAFAAMHFFEVGFVFIVILAALAGFAGHRFFPGQFPPGKIHGPTGTQNAPIELPPLPSPTWQRNARVVAFGLALWWMPVLALGFWLGWESTPAQQGLFFSKAALVTFGGAYAVLPYVAQQAVENFQWLSNTQMMAGLALAETTPGPLIMVLQFVGFLGAWQNPGSLPPLAAALAGSAITTWVTFLPSFLFVFLGAPWIEKIANFPKLSAALAAITACVTGVILNLGVVFAEAALWPEGSGFDAFVAIIAGVAFVALRYFKMPLAVVIGTAALAGWIYHAML